MSQPSLPSTQYAVQLIGPSQLRLNRDKAVVPPGPRQIVAKIEAVGLCFSDLKLLKQFADHPRKAAIVSGIDADTLADIPSYVPGELPVVPGHEAVCRIVAVGSDVRHHRLGERVLVQTDYRDLKTPGSNGAFGYNFDGGLQEYVLMDERVILERGGKRFLIPVPDSLGSSAVALVEPWACVEASYVSPERRGPLAGGRMLVVADAGAAVRGLAAACGADKPGHVMGICAAASQTRALRHEMGRSRPDDAQAGPDETTPYDLVEHDAAVAAALEAIAKLGEATFDDIVYFGHDPAVIEALNDRLAAGGLMNIVTAGELIGRPVSVGVGRVHYGLTRWVGTVTDDASDSYKHIPATGEIRAGERMLVVGAGGPMGQMHVIRNICSGTAGLSIVASDTDDGRLNLLMEKARPLADARNVQLTAVNATRTTDPAQTAGPARRHTYYAIMAPVAPLVADAVRSAGDGAVINIFAGIPAPTKHPLDLDAYIAKRCYMFGTSGSVIGDMEIVLAKVSAGQLDTDCSVDAVCGMAGAIESLAAVEHRTLAGKIIVYPALRETGLIPLNRLREHFPTVAAKLHNGGWCKEAESELLAVAK